MDIKKLNKNIKFNNKRFDESSKAEKRVLIARDVLASIVAGITEAEQGEYLPDIQLLGVEKQLNKAMESEADVKSCSVCALGNLFLHDVIRRNAYTVEEFGNDSRKLDERGVIIKRLGEYFTIKQLDKIESCFEECEHTNHNTYVKDAIALGYKYWSEYRKICKTLDREDIFYEDSNYKMYQIMSNIIRNKGSFKTSDETIAKLPKRLK